MEKILFFLSLVSEDTDTETEGMNEQDEDILFGSQSNNSHLRRHKSRTGNLLQSMNTNLNPLDHSSSDPLINKLHSMRSTLESCPQIWSELAKSCPEKLALYDERLCDEKVTLTFEEANAAVKKSAALFQSLGVSKGTHIAILGENSGNWLLIDHGIQLAGGISAVRGADAPVEELRYIYEHSDSAGVAVLQGPKLLQRLIVDARKRNANGIGLENESHGPVKTIILMHKEKKSVEDIEEMVAGLGIRVMVFQDLIEATSPIAAESIPFVSKEDLSTIVYTSGTTGQPKGVMLTHGNLLHQIGHRISPTLSYDDGEPIPGELMLSLLPVWHITERTFELWMLSRGCSVVYSSIRTFKKDLEKHKPQWLVLVPRVLEKVALGVQAKFASGSAVVKTLVKIFTRTSAMKAHHDKVSRGLTVGTQRENPLISKMIVAALSPINRLGTKLVWSKVQEGFGGRNKVIISGGSALAGSLESFYENCGVNICVGYGLTECSPLLSHRRADSNLVTGGCVGQPCIDTEVRVVDPDVKPENIKGERKSLPPGEVGVVIGRGPQVMKGYYKNPDATSKAVDKFGFFDTGDLGRINPATGDLILTGRIKDTIVLSNGENIEPSPIEDAILGQTSLVEQVMLTGQDGKSLTAIVVLNPTALIENGFLDSKKGESLQKLNEKINDPKCLEEESSAMCSDLSDASSDIRSNDDLMTKLMSEVREATKSFRKWEQVGSLHVTLEPFAMSNGLLTQSYKVKRDAVLNRYKDEV